MSSKLVRPLEIKGLRDREDPTSFCIVMIYQNEQGDYIVDRAECKSQTSKLDCSIEYSKKFRSISDAFDAYDQIIDNRSHSHVKFEPKPASVKRVWSLVSVRNNEIEMYDYETKTFHNEKGYAYIAIHGSMHTPEDICVVVRSLAPNSNRWTYIGAKFEAFMEPNSIRQLLFYSYKHRNEDLSSVIEKLKNKVTQLRIERTLKKCISNGVLINVDYESVKDSNEFHFVPNEKTVTIEQGLHWFEVVGSMLSDAKFKRAFLTATSGIDGLVPSKQAVDSLIKQWED